MYIEEVLEDVIDIIYIVFMDDILIFSEDPKEYIRYIRIVLKKLIEASLYIKLSKCKF
jgi:hypothetical protein